MVQQTQWNSERKMYTKGQDHLNFSQSSSFGFPQHFFYNWISVFESKYIFTCSTSTIFVVRDIYCTSGAYLELQTNRQEFKITQQKIPNTSIFLLNLLLLPAKYIDKLPGTSELHCCHKSKAEYSSHLPSCRLNTWC